MIDLSDSDDIIPALQNSMYQHIDFDKISTFNEEELGSGKAIVKKTWTERLAEKPELESDTDEQLLMHIPSVTNPNPATNANVNLSTASLVK